MYKKKVQKGRSNHSSSSSSSSSLSHVIFDILGKLASDGVLMPDQVLRDLTLAISYRKRVGQFYHSLPQVSADDHARHEWLIEQLGQLAKAFRHNQQQHQQHVQTNNTSSSNNNNKSDGNDEEIQANNTQSMREGFEVLAVRDDEEEEEDSSSSQDDDETVVKSKSPAACLTATPSPEELEAEERLFAISLLLYEMDGIRMDLKDRWKDWARQPLKNDNEAAQDLLAITACTECALSAVRKSIL